MSKAPQQDLYERIGKVTIDGRTKAYKDAVSRLQNAAEIRQQRRDDAARSAGHSDGHDPAPAVIAAVEPQEEITVAEEEEETLLTPAQKIVNNRVTGILNNNHTAKD
jgi:hypothetical protein